MLAEFIVCLSALGWDLTAFASLKLKTVASLICCLCFCFTEWLDLSSKKRISKPVFLAILFHLDLGSMCSNLV